MEEDGEFYYHEIIGLEVYEDDVLLGRIKEILQPGANDELSGSTYGAFSEILMVYEAINLANL